MEENTTETHSASGLHTFHTFIDNGVKVLLSEKRAQILIRSVTGN